MKEPNQCENIDEIRAAIDSIDKQVLELIAKRFQYVKEIVKFKAEDEESIIAKRRYDEVLNRRRELAIQNELNPDVIEEIYKILIHYFIEEELKILKQKKS